MQMETSQNNELDTAQKPWLFSIFKEALGTLILGILSGTTIAYFISRVFIRSYLDTIGFGGLAYDALLDNDTISAFTLGIGMIIFLYIFVFTLPSLLLRHLYHEQVHLMQSFHDKYKLRIDIYLALAIFFLPVTIPLLLEAGQKIEWYFVINLIIPILLWSVITYHNSIRKDTNNKRQFDKGKLFSLNTLKLFIVALIFSMLLVVTFFPFYLVISAISNLGVDFKGSWIVAIVIWLFYSLFCGFRITENHRVHLLLDFILGLGLLFITLLYSSNTINMPIATFVGIKDPSARIYKISEKDFNEIEKNIITLWDNNMPSNQCLFQDTMPNYKIRSAKNSLTKDTYLSTIVIFRDSKNLILCPPDYNIGYKQSNTTCFLAKSEIFTPTNLDINKLNENSAFIDKVWITNTHEKK